MPNWTKEQQLAISKSGENIIVSAGAGSGKTAVLTERVIQKLKRGIHIHELLILTFTKAAAAEMKERIRKSIKKSPDLGEELSTIDRAYITTFDSFSLAILKKYHYVLGLDKDISISEESLLSMKKKEILETIFEEFYTEENKDFENMISTFCTKDDENLKASILGMVKKCELKYDLDDFLNHYLEDYYSNDSIEQYISEYQKRIREKKKAIKEGFNFLSSFIDGDYYEKVEEYLNPILETEQLEDLRQILTSTKFPSLPRGSEEETKAAKKELSSLIDELASYLEYGSLEEMRESVLKTKNTASVILQILKRYFDRIKEYKRKNNYYEFSDIASMAIEILNTNPEIREEVKSSFKEILVDEYQDTNDLQETFVSLIADNNVYMVGDVKQSIYRFRNANPHIFREKYNAYQKHDGGAKIDLLKNFRSRKEVLEDINTMFRQIMDDEVGGADYVVSHQMIFGNNAYEEEGKKKESSTSEIYQYTSLKQEGYSNDEVEAFLVARDIQKKVESKYTIFDKDIKEQRPASYSDFVILMDRTTTFSLYKKIFEYLNVPLTLYKDETLEQSTDLSLIKNIVDFLIHMKGKNFDTAFTYNFVSIARSFLYTLKDEEILDIVTSKKYFETVIYQDLEPIVECLDSNDIYHILLSILESTNFYQKSIEVGDIEEREVRITKVLELAHNLDQSGYSIYEFKEYLEKLLKEGYSIRYSMNTDTGDSVKIMTIHKSKGLEYPVCYFTGLYKTFNIMDIKDKFLYSEKYGFLLPYFEEGIAETFLKLLMKENYLEEEVSEKIRLFYVALTRAKEKMIFFLPYQALDNGSEELISTTKRKKYRSFAHILNSLKGSIQKEYQVLELKKDDFTKEYLLPVEMLKESFTSLEKLNVSELEIEKEERQEKHFSKSTSHIITKEEIENMRFGSTVHEILEYLDFKNPNFEDIENTFIRQKIEKFFKHPLLKEVENATVYKEFEFLYEEDNTTYHGIIDCMLEYDNDIDLIDYKLKNVTDEAYINQLSGYKTYLEKISNKKVNLYLYSIIDSKIEEIS